MVISIHMVRISKQRQTCSPDLSRKLMLRGISVHRCPILGLLGLHRCLVSLLNLRLLHGTAIAMVWRASHWRRGCRSLHLRDRCSLHLRYLTSQMCA